MENVTKKNILIAEFMDDSGEFKYNRGRAGCIESLHYHDDWEWLMPVVGRLSDIVIGGGITYGLKEALFAANIERVFLEVVGLIEWLKDNRPKYL